MSFLQRLAPLIRKEFLQVFRDRRMRMVIFVLPTIQVLVFGYAATNDVSRVPTAVLDRDRTPQSREFVSRFTGSGYFTREETPESDAEAALLLDRGVVSALLELPYGFGADVAAGRTGKAQLILDGSDSNTAAVVAAYAARIVGTASREETARRISLWVGAAPAPPGVRLAARAWFNENLLSRNYFVPGVVANLLLIVTLTLTSMAVVREFEIGTIEQILVTPLRPREFLLGKTLPFAAIGVIDVALISAVGTLWFGVPLRGNPLTLLLGAVLFLMSSLGAGLLISTVSRTQQQAMMTVFFYAFPAILLSGFAFPIANMPETVQWLTWLNPMRYFLVIVRGVFLKGVGLDVLWPEMASLTVLGVATLALAASRFRRTLG